MPTWKVQIFGKECSEAWEISVVRTDNKHGQSSWGWFDENKLLVSHNGGLCRWPLTKFVWDRQVQIAHDICNMLNSINPSQGN
jgi:hypothetical protein